MWEPLTQVVRDLGDLLWPPRCFACSQLLENSRVGRFCCACQKALLPPIVPTCQRCAATVGPYLDTSQGCVTCRGKHYQFHQALRFGVYEGLLRDLILKGKQIPGIAILEELVTLWVERDRTRFEELKPTAIVPIPLHFTRRWRRGFNQAEIIAEQLGKLLQIPVQASWLKKVRRTPYQYQVSAQQRTENLRGAFALRDSKVIPNTRILLVDDVMTTGGTLDSAARVCRRAGCAQVAVAVLALRAWTPG
jgi:ComF family protein